MSMMFSQLICMRYFIRLGRLQTTVSTNTVVCCRAISCVKWNRKRVSCPRLTKLAMSESLHLDHQITRAAANFTGAPPTHDDQCMLSDTEYEEVVEQTLSSLLDVFEQLAEGDLGSSDFDVEFASGVLTVNLGQHGTYVINKQTPNRQIWLSSPISGPKRYDYRNGVWIYKHDGQTLHHLISEELSDTFGQPVIFTKCAYATPNTQA